MKLSQKKANKLFLQAIEDGDLNAVKYLLNDSPTKANLHVVNSESEDPEYCLIVAVEHDRLEILKYLLEETELKKYTQVKGIQKYVEMNFSDTLNIMYEYAGQKGNLETIQYLIKNLYLEDKIQMFHNAALNNHIEVMDYLIKNKVLSKNDKENLGEMKNKSLEWALSYNKKESFQYLMEYYKTTKHKSKFESLAFKMYALARTINSIKKDTTDFELFNLFFNDKDIVNNQDMFRTDKIFREIAKKKNLELYKNSIEKIKDKELKKQLVLDSHPFATEDTGSIKDYPIYLYILDNYKSYFNAEEKEKIFYGLIYERHATKFPELMEYDFMKKGVDPNKILVEAFEKLYVEDTLELIKLILTSEFKDKIKINYNDSRFFQCIQKHLNAEPEQAIELLTVIKENYPETKIKKFDYYFDEKPQIREFINKWKLSNKLEAAMPEKNITIKKLKI